MKLVLFIHGIEKGFTMCDFVGNALVHQELLKNAVEKLKLVHKNEIIKADYWEIFIYQKSKL